MKSKRPAVLGFDTSNYTTSVALMDINGEVLASDRKLLTVPEGSRGLRQSDALFQHVKKLPELLEKMKPELSVTDIIGIGASVTPRPVEGSYMPVFLAGEAVARSMAAREGVPFCPFSHQEGHVAAGLWSEGVVYTDSFFALHLSGGTTELLEITPKNNSGYDIVIASSTKDISIGQLVDRVGVSMGYSFPAGPQLEEIALRWDGELISIPGGVKGLDLNFSGPETFLQKKIKESQNPSLIARSLFQFLGKSISKWLLNHHRLRPIPLLLVVGGVASNSIFRKALDEDMAKMAEVIYAQPEHCSDNALGVCALTIQQLGYHKG